MTTIVFVVVTHTSSVSHTVSVMAVSALTEVLIPPGLDVLIEFRFHFHIQRTAPPVDRSINRTESPGEGFSGDQVKSATRPEAALDGAVVGTVVGIVEVVVDGGGVVPALPGTVDGVTWRESEVDAGAARSTTMVVGDASGRARCTSAPPSRAAGTERTAATMTATVLPTRWGRWGLVDMGGTYGGTATLLWGISLDYRIGGSRPGVAA